MYKNKKDLLENILTNHKELFEILCKEGNQDIIYAIRTIERNIEYMEAFVNNEEDIEIYELLHSIKKNYYSMYTPRGGFNEFYIWKENSDDAYEANLEVDRIKGELIKYFNSIN